MKNFNYVDEDTVVAKGNHGSRIKRIRDEENYDDHGRKPQWRADRRKAKRDKDHRLGINE